MAARLRRKPVSDINVVPYIDVMLVLLVIFMITAPLLVQGIKIELPSAQGNSLNIDPLKTLMIKVDIQGNYYLSEGMGKEVSMSGDTLVTRVQTLLQTSPNMPVVIAGDAEVRYIRVMNILSLLKQAGIENVGLMTQPLEK